MKPIRLFVDAHQFDHGFEGSASFIQGLYLALVRQRPDEFRIYLGCAHPDKVLSSFDGDPHFEAIPYGATNRVRRLAYEIPKAVARLRPDFAHFQYFTPLIKTCPWIVTIHDVLFNDFPEYFPPGYARVRNVLFPLSARRADLLTTVSPYSKERISAWYGIAPGRIEVIPNGVTRNRSGDAGLSAPRTDVAKLLDSSAGYLLCVSRFEPRKNQATVLQAFSDGGFWAQGMNLVFVGSRTLDGGAFDGAYSSLPTAAKARVHLLEGLSFDDLHRLYAHAVAAVYPSLAEGFGMPPLEAAVAGTPSLCARNTAMSDFTPLTPYFFDAHDRVGLMQMLRDVIEHRNAHREAAKLIAEEVMRRFSWEASARKFGELIDQRRALPNEQRHGARI